MAVITVTIEQNESTVLRAFALADADVAAIVEAYAADKQLPSLRAQDGAELPRDLLWTATIWLAACMQQAADKAVQHKRHAAAVSATANVPSIVITLVE